jgi:Flp pilus assembly protein TadD
MPEVNLAALLQDQHRYEAAISHYRRALMLNDDASIRVSLSGALSDAGQLVESRTLLERTVRDYPSSGDAHEALAHLYRDEGDPRNIDEYNRAIRQRPTDAGFRVNLGVALARAGRLHEAIESYRDALRIEPLSVNARLNLAIAYLHQGKQPDAMQSLDEAQKADASDPRPSDYRGVICLQAGDLNGAESEFRKALAIDPDFAPARTHLASLLKQTGREAEATHLLAEARLKPDAAAAR